MENIEKSIIEYANSLCKSAFMDFPDYDEENPITTLVDALTVIVWDSTQLECDSSEVYDFLNARIKQPDFETHEDDAHGYLTGDFTKEERANFKK